jgi:hypothetical protein
MRSLRPRGLASALAIAAVITLSLAWAQAAYALVQLRYSVDGGAFTTITDGGAGDTDLLANDSVKVDATVDSFTIHVTGSGVSPLPGIAITGLDTTPSVTKESTPGVAHFLTLELTDTGFSFPVGPATLESMFKLNSFLAAAGSTASAKQSVSLSNTPFGTDGLTLSHGSFPPGSFPANTQGPTPFDSTSVIAITESVVLAFSDLAGNGFANFNFTSSAISASAPTTIPQPHALLLLGLGLALFGALPMWRASRERREG